MPRWVALIALLQQFVPFAAAQECTLATPWMCGPTDTPAAAAHSTDLIGGRSDDDAVHVIEVVNPRGAQIPLRIFARDLVDPAAAARRFCILHSFAGVESCARDIMLGLAPDLDRLRRQHAMQVPQKHFSGYTAAKHYEDHRSAVGGLWDTIGPLQLDFMRSRGLQNNSTLLDLGCGSLRGGVHLVRYLEPANYFGIDINHFLLDAGYDKELSEEAKLKLPRSSLYASPNYDATHFGTAKFDFALSVSLWTHLHASELHRCLSAMRPAMRAGAKYFTSVFICDSSSDGAASAHACSNQANASDEDFDRKCSTTLQSSSLCERPLRHKADLLGPRYDVTTYPDKDPYHFSVGQLASIAQELSLGFTYIGAWGHPRDQMMLMISF